MVMIILEINLTIYPMKAIFLLNLLGWFNYSSSSLYLHFIILKPRIIVRFEGYITRMRLGIFL